MFININFNIIYFNIIKFYLFFLFNLFKLFEIRIVVLLNDVNPLSCLYLLYIHFTSFTNLSYIGLDFLGDIENDNINPIKWSNENTTGFLLIIV